MDAYSKHAGGLKEVLLTLNIDGYSPFVFSTQRDLKWMEDKIENLLGI